MHSSRLIEYGMLACVALVVGAFGVVNVNPLDFLTQHFPGLKTAGITACETGHAICRLAVPEWSAAGVEWLNNSIEPVFDAVTAAINALLTIIEYVFITWPAWVVILLLTPLGYTLGGIRIGGFVLAALSAVAAMGYLNEMMVTLSLVVTATLLALLFGIPTGIAKAHSRILTHTIDPILDFMQTMPLFVYLIPAVLFFSIGNVPGIVATFIFATPPAVRLTALGIEQIPGGLLEAGHAFGASPWQFLTKVEIPLALPSIMAGVNQSIMLALSMVVVAAMVGAEGLGFVVFRAITRLDVGVGIASGIGIVLLAMILDKMTRAAAQKQQ